MHYRTRLRLSSIPFVVVSICLAAFGAVAWIPKVKSMLGGEASFLPWVVLGVVALIPLAFAVWYALSYADVRRNRFQVRSLLAKREIDLRQLVAAEVFAKASGRSKRKQLELILRLEDATGSEVWLPLNAWRDEDLLMARVLRATVERKVRIEGEPMLVRRFSLLLETYKSWDRQQAAA